MARYELKGPDGRRYEVQAPDSATEEEVLTRFQREVGRAPQEMGEAERGLRRGVNRFTMGLGNYPLDAFSAAVRSAGSDSEGFGPEFRRQRQRTMQAISSEDRGTAGTLGDVATDTAAYTGQAIAMAPMTVARTGAELMTGGAAALRGAYGRMFERGATPSAEALQASVPSVNALTRLQIARESGRVGAAFGVGEGVGNTPPDATTADVLERMGTHGAGGYAIGRALPPIFNFVGDYVVGPVRNALTRRAQRGAEQAQERAADFQALDVPEFTPALGGDLTQTTAANLEGTLAGSSLRTSARESLEALERRLQQELGTMTPAEAGDQAQAFLRRQLTEETLPRADVETMTPQQLQDLSGVGPGPHVRATPPRVAPTTPDAVQPLTPDAYLEQLGQAVPQATPRTVPDVPPRLAPIDRVEVPPEILTQQGELLGRIENLRAQHAMALQSQQQVYELLRPAIRGRADGPNFRLLPRDDLDRMRAQHYQQLADDVARLEAEHTQAVMAHDQLVQTWEQMRPRVMQEQQALADEAARLAAQRETLEARSAAIAEAERATEARRSQVIEAARPSATEQAAVRTQQLQQEARERAAADTARRQATSDQEFQTDFAARQARADEPFELGRSQESYPTEFAGAYEQLRRNAPNVSPKLLGARVPQRERVPRPRYGERYTPQEIEDAVAAWQAMRSTPRPPETLKDFVRKLGGIRDEHGEVRNILGGERSPLLRRNGRTLDEIGEAAQQAGFFTERPTIPELLQALEGDLRGTNPFVRQVDQEALLALRESQQVAEDLERLGVRGARNANQVRSIMEREQVQLPPRPQEGRDLSVYDDTATVRLLGEFATEARGTTKLPGFKGPIFDEAGRVKPELLEYLRPRLGAEITDMLAYMSEARARNLATPTMQGGRDIITNIGQAIRRAREGSRFPGEPRGGAAGEAGLNDQMLSRLYDAVNADVRTAAGRAGRAGETYARQSDQIDTAYRQYVQEIRKPLAKVFGEKVDPVRAIGELVKAAGRGGDINLLRAFFRVVDDKGDRQVATSWLLHNMTEGGLDGFLAAYRNLSDDARALIFQGQSQPLGEVLERAARVGGYLERYARAAQDSSSLRGMVNPGNIGLALAYTISAPALIKAYLGGEAASRVLASRWYASWLKAMPVEKGPRSQEWQRHVNRLRGMASEQLGVNAEAIKGLIGAFTSQAQAGPTAPGVIADMGEDARGYDQGPSAFEHYDKLFPGGSLQRGADSRMRHVLPPDPGARGRSYTPMEYGIAERRRSRGRLGQGDMDFPALTDDERDILLGRDRPIYPERRNALTTPIADRRPAEASPETLGGEPRQRKEGTSGEQLGQHNLIDRMLRSFGQESVDALEAGLQGALPPDEVARIFLQSGPVGPFGGVRGGARFPPGSMSNEARDNLSRHSRERAQSRTRQNGRFADTVEIEDLQGWRDAIASGDMSLREAADRIGLSWHSLRDRFDRAGMWPIERSAHPSVSGRPRVEVDMDIVRRMLEDEQTVAAIARKLSVSPQVVAARMREAGITRNALTEEY